MFNFGTIDFITDGAVNAGMLQSVWCEAPVIDGYLNETSWQSATKTNYTLYDYNNQSNTLTIEMRSMYSDNNFLYIGAEVEETYSDSNGLILIFQVNESNELIADLDPAIEFGDGHDAKYVSTDGQRADGYTSGTSIKEDCCICFT